MTPYSRTLSWGNENQGEPTREEKLRQVYDILEDNILRSKWLHMAFDDYEDGKAPQLALQKDLIILEELRSYAVRRDNLSIQYEKDYAVVTKRHTEERDALEAGCATTIYEDDDRYLPWRPTSGEWMRCSHMQNTWQGSTTEEEEEEEESIKSTKCETGSYTEETPGTIFSRLKARIARILSPQKPVREDLESGNSHTVSDPRLESGFCLERQRRLLQSRQQAELKSIYNIYYERTYRAFELTVAKIGPEHLTWWPPSENPLRPNPGTSRAMSPTGPFMVSSSSLDAPYRPLWMAGVNAHEDGDSGYSDDNYDSGGIEGSLQ
ncbi:hypothetical protein F4810DRAFT_706585 [Camillea tinctor]|nr:hypothetical protein F4810DRAFT_706585 [Camillea tinctor]